MKLRSIKVILIKPHKLRLSARYSAKPRDILNYRKRALCVHSIKYKADL